SEHLLPVELEYGVYRIQVTCDGYEPYDRRISVGSKKAEIDIELTDKDEKVSENRAEERKSSSSSVRGSIDYTVTAPPPASSSSSSSAELNAAEEASKSSSSSSDYSQEGIYYDDDDESSSSSSERRFAYLFIDEPDDVEVYYDGSYKGISPLGIKKEPGTHVITLRKDGYVTRSYTLNLSDDDEDESFEFRALSRE
ncbi:MAG: PEGA domain-containing protein, partial [Lachnospiraceae bacterium]|nr:PEGA domain-containing protein [Lachnospiraceae bacterium]